MTDKKRVLIADPIGATGLDLLRKEPGLEVESLGPVEPAELLRRVRDIHALVVRSATRVTAEVLAAAPQLEVVVRAGAGIDNIDVDAATARGVVVMNTPGGNTNAAAEHTMAMLLALARRVPMANRSLAEGRWEREEFVGWELRGKLLGLVGLGRIGGEVASRAQAFRMRVAAFDPFISRDAAASRDIVLLSLEELLETADVVSLHLPLTTQTRHVIDAAAIARMQRGTYIVNCARGGLIDEAALLAALNSGHVAGAALDVFEAEPKPPAELIAHPLLVATPHLGASTQEAKDSVGIQAATQVIGVLTGTSFENALNVSIRDGELMQRLAPFLNLTEKMGALQIQLVESGVCEVSLDVAGQVEDTAPLGLAYLRGLLGPITDTPVNYVNALYLARERGIKVTESRSAPPGDYSTLITSTVKTDSGEHTLRGTVIGKSTPRIVGIDEFWTDAIPAGDLLLCKSLDRPGVIGELGTCCGVHGLNISEFRLGRHVPGGEALSIITLDDAPAESALVALRALPNLVWVKHAKLR